MTKNKYFEKLAPAAVFFSGHFRIIALMCFIVFLFYIAMLGIEINSTVNNIPSADDINKRMQSVSIRKDLIKKIDSFIELRQKENLALSDKNPFLPYQKGIGNSLDGEPVISPAVPSPEIMP